MELWCFLLVCHRDCPFVSSAFLKKSGKRKLLHQHSKLKWRHFLKKCGTLSLSVAWTVKRLRTVPYIFYYDFFDRVKCEILKTERKILNNQATRFIYKHLSPGKIPFVVWKDGKIPLTSIDHGGNCYLKSRLLHQKTGQSEERLISLIFSVQNSSWGPWKARVAISKRPEKFFLVGSALAYFK